MFYTENIEGKVYIVETSSDFFEPKIYVTKWLTVGSEIIPSGLPVSTIGANGYNVKVNGVWMSVNPVQDVHPIFSYMPYPKPKGAKKYNNGDWHS